MTRLANVEKAGYFPLPPPVTKLIETYITAPHGGRILDPCAGEGAALVSLAGGLGLEPFGVELHEGRAQTAREQVAALLAKRLTQSRSAQLPTQTRILHDSYLSLKTSRDGFNLLYLNPPYDHDHEDGRLEYQFLWRTRPYLQPGGLLVYVIPQHILKMRKLAQYVISHFQDIRIYRFPDEFYERFKQIVLFGIHRPKAVAPDPQAVEGLRALAQGDTLLLAKQQLLPLPAASEPVYTLPPLAVKESHFKFRSQFVDPTDALAEARQMGTRTKLAWREHLDPESIDVPLRPLTPLKIGHMNSVIAAGHLNNQVLVEDEERLLIKGRNYKVTRSEEFEEPLPDGRTRVTHLETETVVTDITTIDSTGQVDSHHGPGLETFLQKWITQLTGIVAQDYPPVYQFNLNGYGKLLNSLSKERPIPGMNGKTGLLPAQKHATAAILTRLETYPEAIAIGEMGTGKAQPLDCKVLTPTGWKCMGDIQEGDEVINPEGGTAHVVDVYPQGKKKIYKVTFSDGAQTECCDEHLWQVLTPERKWRNHPPQLFELRQIKDKLYGRSDNARYFIPLVKPVEFDEKPLPLDPYLLGALIGDGGLTNGSPIFTSADNEIIQEAEVVLPDEVSFKRQGKYSYRISRKHREDSDRRNKHSNPVTIALRELGLMGHRSETKFIPKPYRLASVDSRIALLQGLLDTDGTIGPQSDGAVGHITYSTASEILAKDVTELVQSLGGTAKLTTRVPYYMYNGEKRRGRLAYRLNIKLPDCIQPFRLTRKLERVIPRTKYGPTRAMVKVEYIGEKEV